nr:aminotransferase [Sneathiella glossodoripedis]
MTGYGPIEGEPILRHAYCEHVGGLYESKLKPEQIQITSGCNQAFIASVMAIAGAGDSVLVSNPFYFNHATTLAMLGITCKEFDLRAENGFLPDVEDIRQKIDPSVKAVLLVSPNNPTGAVYPPNLLDAIFELCREFGIWLILDETYRDFLPLGQKQPHSIFGIQDWQENFIQLYSFSKSFCIPGHRLGAITTGEQTVVQIAKVMDNLQICAPRPPQEAIAYAIPRLGSWQADNRREIATRADTLKTTLSPLENWQISSIGAYFSYIKHGFDGVSSEIVARELGQNMGISVLPGTFFGSNQEQYLRFAFANVDCDKIQLLGSRLAEFTL